MEQNHISCQVCHRSPSVKLPFFCQTCCRNILYEPRMRYLQTLFDQDELKREIESALGQDASAEKQPTTSKKQEGHTNSKEQLEKLLTKSQESKQRTESILKYGTELKAEIEALRAQLEAKKKTLAQRKNRKDDSTPDLKKEKEETLEAIKEAEQRTNARWDSLNDRAVHSRLFLCREVASLYRLQMRKRKRGTSGRDSYFLAGVPIIDIRDLNGAKPEHATVSYGRLAHLVHLTSHYLGLRPPAEIILPSPSNPYPIMHTPIGSYKDPIFPNSGSSQSKPSPRQRILRLDRPLPQLSSEDPLAYSLFIDAVTLLAWDVAWLAKTQGLDVGASNWEEVCAMGKTMYSLFVAPPPTANPGLLSARRNSNTPTSSSPLRSPPMSRAPSTGQEPNAKTDAVTLALQPGKYTHNSARSFLLSADSNGVAEAMRTWQFSTPYKLIERIKSALASERMGAEWEVLQEEEWEEGETAAGK